ncbi:hypothetical protein [Cellulomonas soli]|uniref:Uncharacterized protein n=1 Tax=Cellulomonas soli TaxID=931535 RepID=A0A512P955_9CELL|nr:hypothetical protein [Cellulomonas soli]NYI57951.1 hypothetical protein [Cellulomonas soli]GEP67734.1 hypothetical protein CSO01_04490 [Cellulomonas soli]
MSEGFAASADSMDTSASALLQVVGTLRPADPGSWSTDEGTYGFVSLANAMGEARSAMTTRVGDLQSVVVGAGAQLQACAEAYREVDERVNEGLRRLQGLLLGPG